MSDSKSSSRLQLAYDDAKEHLEQIKKQNQEQAERIKRDSTLIKAMSHRIKVMKEALSKIRETANVKLDQQCDDPRFLI